MTKFNLKDDELYLNGKIIAQIKEGHIHFSISALEEAGFYGEIEVTTKGFSHHNVGQKLTTFRIP